MNKITNCENCNKELTEKQIVMHQKYCSINCYRTKRHSNGWFLKEDYKKKGTGSVSRACAYKRRTEKINLNKKTIIKPKVDFMVYHGDHWQKLKTQLWLRQFKDLDQVR